MNKKFYFMADDLVMLLIIHICNSYLVPQVIIFKRYIYIFILLEGIYV